MIILFKKKNQKSQGIEGGSLDIENLINLINGAFLTTFLLLGRWFFLHDLDALRIRSHNIIIVLGSDERGGRI
jgi:hypothetical protein